MKLLAILFFVTTVAFAQNQSYDASGEVKTQYKEYLAVVNSASAALTKGQVACPDLTAADGIAVDYCYTAGAKPLGVVVSDCAVGARCKLQTKGIFEAGKFDYLATATVAGGMIYAGTSGDMVAPATVTVDMFPIGIVLEAASADTSALKVYIDL